MRLFSLCALLIGCLLLGGCKDTARSSKSAPVQNIGTQDPTLESLEHKLDDAKTTQRLDNIINTENAIQDATQPTGPMFTPQNNNVLQNWNNHEDNLSSPLNHNY